MSLIFCIFMMAIKFFPLCTFQRHIQHLSEELVVLKGQFPIRERVGGRRAPSSAKARKFLVLGL